MTDEHGNVIPDGGTQTPPVESQEPKKVNVTEVLRDLSKTFSVNLFDENGRSASSSCGRLAGLEVGL